MKRAEHSRGSFLRVGLTGPIGSGKSYVSSWLRGRGFAVYDSDRAAKRVVEVDGSVRRAVVGLLGPGAYDAGGAYQRGWVASRVFRDGTLLAGLNGIVHPAVFRDFSAWAEAERAAGASMVFFESALLPSVGAEYVGFFDCVVLVYASMECRMRRVMARDSAARGAVLARMSSQPSDAAYEALADYTVRNEGDGSLDRQMGELVKQLQQR